MQWKPFKYKDLQFDFSHLHPAEVDYAYGPTKGRPAETYRVLVLYTNHCFTRSPKTDETCAPDCVFPDDYEVRLFDPERYELSKNLPGIITSLGNKKLFTNGNKREKYFCVEIASRDGQTVEYEIYIKLKKIEKGKLELLVESAFVRDPAEKSRRPKGIVVRFVVVLHNTLNGKKLRL